MELFLTVLVTFFAGMGAGLGTGFAGLSAAAVITPMLTTFLGIDPYIAVGIALASDVLASAVSAYTYHKNTNLDVKHGLIMMVSVSASKVHVTADGSLEVPQLPPSVAALALMVNTAKAAITVSRTIRNFFFISIAFFLRNLGII